MRNENIVITRGQLAGWAGTIGGAALLIGLLGLLWQGSLAGSVAIILGIGAVGIVLWAALNPRDAINLATGRQARHGTFAVLSTFIMIGIVSLTYLLALRSVVTVDMTQNTRFTLSDTSHEILRRVTRPMQITGFYSPRLLPNREIDDQYYRQYSAATDGMIRIQYIDPDEQPAVAERFNAQDGSVFISYLNDDGTVDFGSLARVPRSDNQERDVTESLSRLLIAGEISVFFETSFGGRDPLDNSQEGISGINNGARESGLVTYPLNLVELTREGGSIPTEVATVIMPGLTAAFTQETVDIIDEYLQGGGSLFIMADPVFRDRAFLDEEDPFNQYLWENYGLRPRDAVVVDTIASGQTQLDLIGAAVFTGSEIAERLDPEQSPVQFRVARMIEINESPPPNVTNGRIIMSSEASYGETDLQALSEANTFEFDPQTDIPGPLDTVAWANNEANGSRILLVGDSDFVSNGQVLTPGSGNGILFTDGLSWLTGFGERVTFGVGFVNIGLPLVFIDQPTLDAISFLTIIVLPSLMMLAGIVVWVRRLRQ
jgi:hypothetical protein